MIRTLYHAGLALKEMEDYQSFFAPWQNPFPNTKPDTEYLVVIAEVEEGKIIGLELEPFKKALVEKYLFRSIQGANGTNLVPTLYFGVDKNLEKYQEGISKLMKKINASIKNNKHSFVSKNSLEELPQMLEALHSDANYQARYLFTMRVSGKWFGEFDEYVKLFLQDAYQKYYKDSKGTDKICAVTYLPAEEVWGRVDTLGFTVNDIAFSRGGFNDSNSYKMFPVSPEVVKTLEGAKLVMTNHLVHNFYSLQYAILPHLIVPNLDIQEELMRKFLEKADTKKKIQSQKNAVFSYENLIKEIIDSDELSRADVYYDIFFYQQNQAQTLIKLHLSDVLPSRFKKIFEAKEWIEERFAKLNRIVFNKGKKDEKTQEFYFSFVTIRPYFSSGTGADTLFHPYFFKILEAVFYGKYLNYQEVLKAFNKTIQIVAKDPSLGLDFQRLVRESFAVLEFFTVLNLFKHMNMEKIPEVNPIELVTKQFIDQHKHFFDSPYKKGVFLLGCLTKRLLSKQYQKLKNEPFFKQLNGLNIDEKQIQTIFPKLVNKLHEYEANLPNLEQEIAAALVKRSDLSKAETSYVFTLGLTMQGEFSKAWKEGKDAEETI
jgi:CRISPR-associated Csh1 family protein